MTAFIPGDDLQLVLTDAELSDTPGFRRDKNWLQIQYSAEAHQCRNWTYERSVHQRHKDRRRFFYDLDEHSHELSKFALQVFDQKGILKQEVVAGGLGLWDVEDAYQMYARPIVYVQELVVMESWRGRGIGSWAVPQLFDTPEVQAIRSSYLFAWPAVLSYLEPLFSQSTREESMAKGERVLKFFRSIGFRRLANTSFFCLAKDPEHRSRQIPADEDAEFMPLPPPRDDNEVTKRILASW
ncbi:hypothetical protein ARMGADRAFT_154770 [Armillaria gallica]|uniref:N-acetyltransferase domain-containing protein n=1 Tax=Armillaria gallica TaxID=47427 RepID=A0A2H3DDF6_ARMGA|nr:hypothetical protein ARMGADRAFT_154770 [Armillaria gallica]